MPALNVILLLLVLIAPYPLWAASDIQIQSNTVSEHCVEQGALSYWVDPSRTATLKEAQAALNKGLFQPIQGNLGLGYIPDAAWLNLSLHHNNPNVVSCWLEIEPPYLDNIGVYHINSAGHIDFRQGGDHIPQSAKELDYRAHAFRFDFSSGEHQLLIRIQTSSTLAAIVRLWSPDAFNSYLRNSYLVFGLYFSLIFCVMLFNVVSWLVTKRLIFLIYTCYLALNSLQWLSINGFVAQFVFPQQPLLANLTLGLALSLAAAIAYAFFIMVLELRAYHPWLYRISQVGIVLALLTALATPFGYYQTVSPFFFWLTVITITLTPRPIWRLWKTGILWSRLLATAYGIFCLLICINILGTLKVLPFNEWTTLIGMISNIFHILILHFAILLHFRKVEKDHEQALQKSEIASHQLEIEQGLRHEQGQLMAMLTHELKNLLATVRFSVDAIPKAHADHQRVGRIRRALEQMNTIVERCALADRLEQNALKPHISKCNMLGLVEDVIKISGMSQRIQLDVSSELPDIEVDTTLLAVAISNLIDNALKYSPPTSLVNVTLMRGVFNINDQALQGIQLTVRNHAETDDLTDPNRLFEKFFRGSKAHNQSGSGLGLYLVKGITEKLGGQISLNCSHSHMELILWVPTVDY